jgi:hypothetical protein
MGHDPNAARATFVEICFGLNLLWSAFEGFQDLIKKILTNHMQTAIARVQTLEAKNKGNHGKELESFKQQASDMGTQHAEVQKNILTKIKWFTVVATIMCVAILYFDMLDMLGKWLGLLLLPLIAYLIAATFVFWCTSRKIKKIGKKFMDFVEQFPEIDVKRDFGESIDPSTPENPPQS